MFIIDDILLSPFRLCTFLAKKIQDAAVQDLSEEAERITMELSDLYMRLETGQISEGDFDLREKALLDRLEEIDECGENRLS